MIDKVKLLNENHNLTNQRKFFVVDRTDGTNHQVKSREEALHILFTSHGKYSKAIYVDDNIKEGEWGFGGVIFGLYSTDDSNDMSN